MRLRLSVFFFLLLFFFTPVFSSVEDIDELFDRLDELEEKIWTQSTELKVVKSKLKQYQTTPPSFFDYQVHAESNSLVTSQSDDALFTLWDLSLKKTLDRQSFLLSLIQHSQIHTGFEYELAGLTLPLLEKSNLLLTTGPGELMDTAGRLTGYPGDCFSIESDSVSFAYNRQTATTYCLQSNYLYRFSLPSDYELRFGWQKKYYIDQSMKQFITKIKNGDPVYSRDDWLITLVLNKVRIKYKWRQGINGDAYRLFMYQTPGFFDSDVLLQLAEVEDRVVLEQFGDDYGPLSLVDNFEQPIYPGSTVFGITMDKIWDTIYVSVFQIHGANPTVKTYYNSAIKDKESYTRYVAGFCLELSSNMSFKSEIRFQKSVENVDEAGFFTQVSIWIP